MFRFSVFYFWCHHFLASEKKSHFSLLALYHMDQGVFSLASWLSSSSWVFLCNQFRLVAVFAANKAQTNIVCKFSMLFFNFFPSLFEINCIKTQTISLVVNLFQQSKGGSLFSKYQSRYCKIRSLSMRSISCCARAHVSTSVDGK